MTDLPQREYPIHTLDAARGSLQQITVRIRGAQSMKERIMLQEALDNLYTRWPDLRGGADEVVIKGR